MASNSEKAGREGFLSLAFSRQVLPRATKVAFLVGTILAFINHGDKILTMSLSGLDLFKIVFTYLVPYGVSTWSAVRAIEANATNVT